MKIVEYKPFEGSNNFYLAYKDNVPIYLYFKDKKDNSFRLKIKPNGYIPKSGIFLCQSITSLVKGKSVLDIGTGETGIISIYCLKHGSKSATGVDIDRDAVKWAEYNGKLNKTHNANWLVSDKYEKVKDKFDVIISNPPQLPMKIGSLHDSGGYDGRQTVENIIKDSKNHLNSKGILLMLIFDFLSVDHKYGSKPSIFEILEDKGFRPSIIAETRRLIRPDGKTFESLAHIKKLYPKYKFIKDKKGQMYYKMLAIKGSLKD